MDYVPRYAEHQLEKMVEQFPLVILTGPRQCGKSTLLKHFGGQRWHYLTFDKAGILAAARNDPDLWVNELPNHTMIDEAQKGPDIFSSLKARIDEHPDSKFIFSGSANFHLMETVTETFAGRAAIIELYPFSVGEIYRRPPSRFLATLLSTNRVQKTPLTDTSLTPPLEDLLLYGGYPKIIELKGPEAILNWFENYQTTYLERDVRSLAQIGHWSQFQRLYQVLAAQSGNLINFSSLGAELGISVPTCQKYLSVLEASYQVSLLKPYSANIRKRLVRTPKIFYNDTGISNHLLGIRTYEDLKNRGYLGGCLETWVIAEIKKALSLVSPKPRYYFWRTQNDAEVDLLIEWGGKLLPIEIKNAMQIDHRKLRGFESLAPLAKKVELLPGLVLYRGHEILPLSKDLFAIPLEYLWH